MSRRSWRKAIAAAGTAGILAAPLLAAGPAHAATETETATLEVLASGLDNPRGITTLWDGTILVAESGAGLPGCPEGETCVGNTGAVYKVKGDFKGRVATGLASTATGVAPGAPVSASGPEQAVPDYSGGYVVLSNLGGTTESRAALGPDAGTLGTLFRTRDGKVLADLTDHETRLNPDGGEVHANPWRFTRSGSSYLVTDAGANTVVRAHRDGTTSTEYVVPTNATPQRVAESVPTGIVTGHDGTVYVADMSGTVAGSARIWKKAPGEQPEVLVTGLTNLVDLALDCSGNLYALSFTQGFQAGPPKPGLISKIDLETKQVTDIPTGDQLQQPTGLAVGPRGQLYVTNKSNGTDGELVRVRY
ncbi:MULTISPECIES: ScyD/ScyE family protein [Streptomyces]|uniref:ScyD/ScyE family protein n=2 Tax=Streptomyces TaxID=1883 RepID=UPI0013BDC501|nr:ScyD/ScyE family protein [Streptomyces rochei]NEC76639.1 ScyD/ScyE family protein [Streptomyces rochei]